MSGDLNGLAAAGGAGAILGVLLKQLLGAVPVWRRSRTDEFSALTKVQTEMIEGLRRDVDKLKIAVEDCERHRNECLDDVLKMKTALARAGVSIDE